MDSSTVERYSTDRILVIDADDLPHEQIAQTISAQIATSDVQVTDPAHARACLSEREFDIVVFNCPLEDVGGGVLLHELKLLEHDPSVLVIVDTDSPDTLNRLYNSGAHSCIVKTDRWLMELGPAAAALSRQRRTSEAWARRSAQLTEMNRLLREKNRRLDEFSMTVAHDIRGPLGGIGMNIEYVLDTWAGEIPEKATSLLQRALDASQRLTDIVQAMYGFAKLGAQAAKMAEVDLQELIPKVAQDLHFNESLDIRLSIGDLPCVWGNTELLSRVFLNLISNAVKYGDKTPIIIDIAKIKIEERTIGRYATIAVTDNGPGISEHALQGLFTMFMRAKETSKKEGLGIGLAMVHRIIELHYGEISVESKVGEGTRFLISLPMDNSDLLA